MNKDISLEVSKPQWSASTRGKYTTRLEKSYRPLRNWDFILRLQGSHRRIFGKKKHELVFGFRKNTSGAVL